MRLPVLPAQSLDDDFEKVMSLHAHRGGKDILGLRESLPHFLGKREDGILDEGTPEPAERAGGRGLISVTKILIKEGSDDKLKLFQKERKSSSGKNTPTFFYRRRFIITSKRKPRVAQLDTLPLSSEKTSSKEYSVSFHHAS